MGLFEKIRRHAAIAKGDFGTIFKNKDVPPLPAVANRLLAEINRPEPDIDRLVELLASTSEIAAKVIKTVNSSLFGLRMPVSDIKHAVTLLGIRHIRSIALAYVTMDGLPKPDGDLFDHRAFWTDSLLQAILARALAKPGFAQQTEEAFTASLLAGIPESGMTFWQKLVNKTFQKR
jgi:HD-like signal output (HDOD) protein